jgi:hypothetical protein
VEWGSFTGDLEGYVKVGSGGGHLSPWGPCWGNLEGGIFTADSERHVREGFGRGAALSLQRLREGNLKGGLPY